MYTKIEKKRNGIFYTPPFLADYLAKKIITYSKYNRFQNVLDPACGDSILLKSYIESIDPHKKKSRTTIVANDKDSAAVNRSSRLLESLSRPSITHHCVNYDGLFPFNDLDPKMGWDKVRKELGIEGKFDLILSNPPWGSDLGVYSSRLLSSSFALAKGQYDIYDLFIEVILANLRQGGIFGLILPDSIFSIEQSELRKTLITETSILFIARLGEKIFTEINRACVIIIGRYNNPDSEHQVQCFRLNTENKTKVLAGEKSLEETEKNTSHYIPQLRFMTNPNYEFDIDLSINEMKTFSKIRSIGLPLKGFVTSTRGVELSKKGIVCRCPVCRIWSPVPKSKILKCVHCKHQTALDICEKKKIIETVYRPKYKKLKAGEDLYRFTSYSSKWINIGLKGINYKDLNLYNGLKILVRKTGVGITASLDYEDSLTNQVVYILKLKPEHSPNITLEFVLSVLNSRVMTYYLLKKYGESEWKSHPYITQALLMELPFPNIDYKAPENIKTVKTITKMVSRDVQGTPKKNLSIYIDLEIERAIAKLFKLNMSDYKKIYKTLESAQQLIPIKRLLNISIKDIFNTNGI
ncbi:MAG: N-6 DNA methylase [Ignavibacteria bacterium]|nr:N-6 DNA methylase [Ignavibacteria bacterium]